MPKSSAVSFREVGVRAHVGDTVMHFDSAGTGAPAIVTAVDDPDGRLVYLTRFERYSIAHVGAVMAGEDGRTAPNSWRPL